jgi:transposase-like protein
MNGEYRIIDGQYDLREQTQQLIRYFHKLRDSGLTPVSATVDGKPVITKALLAVWPDILIQRCLVHLQRQGLMWCRRNPKRPDARHLRHLLLTVTKIRTYRERDTFLMRLATWEKRYGRKLALLPPKGWVLTDMQRARSMILNAVPDMFRYLENSRIPKTTNGLEGYFSRLKLRYRQHRGLSRGKRLSYFTWYFTLVRR